MEICPNVYSKGLFCQNMSTSTFYRVVRPRGQCLSRHFLVRAVIPENNRVWNETKIIGLNSLCLSPIGDSLSNAHLEAKFGLSHYENWNKCFIIKSSVFKLFNLNSIKHWWGERVWCWGFRGPVLKMSWGF